jgi:3-dehydroquinate synthase
MAQETGNAPVRVDLGERSYDIWAAPGCLNQIGEIVLHIVNPTRAVVVTGTGAVERYGRLAADRLDEAGIPTELLRLRSGERYKTLRAVERLYHGMLRSGLDRKSVVVAVGGGVVGDVAGFAAGTYMRGISFVQAPTTLLAQADAGVGGKTGVNLPEGKNLVGVFHQPRAVLMDTETLATLSARDYLSGMAEIVKHAFIRDADFLDWLRWNADRLDPARRDAAALAQAVRRSCEIKAAVVVADETEAGIRAVLNFGHTVGHALESLGSYRRLTHGEAVAIGMVAACRIGEELGITPSNVTMTVRETLRSIGLPTALPPGMEPEAVARHMMADKKATSGRPRFVLLQELGQPVYGVEADAAAVLRALERSRE